MQVAAVAQLGERETEDLKVTSSILVRGTIFIKLIINLLTLLLTPLKPAHCQLCLPFTIPSTFS